MIFKKLESMVNRYYGRFRRYLLHRLVFGRLYFIYQARKNDIQLNADFDLLIFCDQPSHWQNVVLIAESFTKQFPSNKVCLVTTYLTKAYPNEKYPETCKTLHGFSYSYLRYFKAKILLTPFVGLKMAWRPKGCFVVHAIHSLSGLDGVYASWMFEGLDYILCAGPHQIHDFQRWAKQFSTFTGKVLIPAGYPKLDLLLKKSTGSISNQQLNKRTIVYAPTLVHSVNEKLASLRKSGQMIVSTLLSLGYHVIFRPHPASLNDQDRFLIAEIIKTHENNSNFEFDNSKDYFLAYSRADALVTDLSGTGFTFSFAFAKPSIFYVEKEEAERNLEGVQFQEREKIGCVVRSIENLVASLNKLNFEEKSQEIREYRLKQVFNLEQSADYIAFNLQKMLNHQKSQDWVSI